MALEKNINFTPGIFSGYQNCEGLAGLSKKGWCGVYIKETIPYITRPDLSLNCQNTHFEFEVKDNIPIGITYRHPK